jgi:hypothetical protein
MPEQGSRKYRRGERTFTNGIDPASGTHGWQATSPARLPAVRMVLSA